MSEQETGEALVGAGRAKWWSELTIEEKVERTREKLKMVTKQLHFFEESLNKLNNHIHSGNDMYFKDPRWGYDESGQLVRPGPGKDDVYF